MSEAGSKSINSLHSNSLPAIRVNSPPRSRQKSQHLLVEEEKQMRDLVANSMQISKRLHSQMMEKEYDIKNHVNHNNRQLKGMYQEMEEVYRKNQNLYEEIVHQNQKTRFLVEEIVKPFREELRAKVDERTLSVKMRMLLEEFDNIGHNITYEREKYQLEQYKTQFYSFIKDEILPVIADLSRQVKEIQSKPKEQEEGTVLPGEIVELRKMVSDVSDKQVKDLPARLTMTQNKIKQLFEISRGTQSRLKQQVGELNQALKKFDDKVDRKEMAQKLLVMQKARKQDIQEVVEQQVENLNESIKQLDFKTAKADEKLSNSLDKLSKKLSDFDEKVNNDLAQQRQFAIDLIGRVKKQALQDNNSPSRNVLKRLNNIEAVAKSLQDQIRKVESDMEGLDSEQKTVRELLSQKANYSDILKQVEGKADKADYSDLRAILTGASHKRISKLDLPMTHSDMRNPHKQKSLSIQRKKQHLQANSPSPNMSEISGREKDFDGTHMGRFVLGLSDHTSLRKEREKTRYMLMRVTGNPMRQSLPEPQ